KPIDCAHRALEEGVIGRLLLSTTHFMRTGSDRSRRPATRRAPRAWCGDDVFLTSLLHHLDALQAVAGESITELRGLSTILSNGGGEEESVAATLRYEGGALGAVVTCLSPPGPSLFQDSFVGTDGRLLVDKRIVQVIRRGAESPYHPKEWCTWEFPAQDDSRLRFVEEFCRSVQTGEPPPVPAAYGIELLRLIAQATRPSGAELRGCASP
ncbi:MAG: Gfo/Idh/MocA family oxidoreductase, partial [Planctomycetota bacterium]